MSRKIVDELNYSNLVISQLEEQRKNDITKMSELEITIKALQHEIRKKEEMIIRLLDGKNNQENK